ncbi:MAG: site-specific integrase [Defluviitaleaceae bacterium]|nr:site-specific integrase [Defluviitaleaceae bacterium]MCL2273956.1 site-specific integrase [Defluviitaleaceae bacterium]
MAKKTNVSINGSNYFKVTATVGIDSDGTAIKKQFYGSSKKEAIRKRDEYLNVSKSGIALRYIDVNFLTAFNEWFENVMRPSVSLSTFNRHETEFNKRIKTSKLANMKLNDVRSVNVQAFYNDILKTYTPSTVKSTHRLLSSFFIYCVKADIIIKNPLNAVVLPKITKLEKVNKALSDDDVKILLQVARDNVKYFPFVFALFTGLRAGEMLALRNSDIDFGAGIIRVERSIKFLSVNGEYVPVISVPKTASGIRSVPILSDIRDLLDAHIIYEQEKHKRLEIEYGNESILFSSDTCTYRETPNMLTTFKRLCKRVGIELYTLHSLRHTFCTILAKQGVPLKTASVLMGHSDISVTANIYTSVDDLELRKGIERLSTYF